MKRINMDKEQSLISGIAFLIYDKKYDFNNLKI